MSEYILRIKGIIGTKQKGDPNSDYFNYSDFLSQLNLFKKSGSDTLILDIDSEGGYVDVADRIITDLIILKNEGINIFSRNSGNVCSAATKLFCVAPLNNRIFYPERGLFLVHNPFSEFVGDSDSMMRESLVLKTIENQYIDFYNKATGTDSNILKNLMIEDEALKPETIESLNFARVVYYSVKAFARVKSDEIIVNKKIDIKKMDEKVLTDKLSIIEKLVKNLGSFRVKSLMITDAAGIEIQLPAITDVSEIKVGADIEAENGDIVMPDSSVIKVVGKKIVEIIEAVKEEVAVSPADEEVTNLKDENEALKAELEALKADIEKSKEDSKALFENIKAEMKSLKALSSNHKAQVVDSIEKKNEVVEFSFKSKRRK